MIAVHNVFVGAQLLARVILASPATMDNISNNFHTPRVTPPPRLEQVLRRESKQRRHMRICLRLILYVMSDAKPSSIALTSLCFQCPPSPAHRHLHALPTHTLVFMAAARFLLQSRVPWRLRELHQRICQDFVLTTPASQMAQSPNVRKLNPLNVTDGCLTIVPRQW
jgi:hypothetical protein